MQTEDNLVQNVEKESILVPQKAGSLTQFERETGGKNNSKPREASCGFENEKLTKKTRQMLDRLKTFTTFGR
ncbi:MAG: hypothetical protein KF734_00380 [Saprospiraceae bacterium]|nr:hypothetical protein [Saprospiraceae bacterium]